MISILVPLIPILSIYASPVPGVTIGDFGCLIIMGYCLLKRKFMFYVLSELRYLLYFALLVILVAVVSIVSPSQQRTDIIVRSIRIVFYIVTVSIASMSSALSLEKASKFCVGIAMVATVYIVIQYVAFYTKGAILPGYLPGLPVYLDQYTQIDYARVYTSYFRPTSFFLEPASYSQYAIVALCLSLLGSHKSIKPLIIPVFISVGIILSTSSQGIVLCVLMWVIYFLLAARKNKRLFMLTPIFLALFLLAIQVPSLRLSIARLLTPPSNPSGAVYARMGGLSSLGSLSLPHFLFGQGYGFVYDIPGISAILLVIWGTGLLGFALLTVFFVDNTLNKIITAETRYQGTIGLLFFASLLYSNIFNSYMLVYYLFFFVRPDVGKTITDHNLKGRLLFLFGMFHPRMSANGVCTDKVMRECVEQGYGVSCVVNQSIGVENHQCIDGIHVHRIMPRLSYRLLERAERTQYISCKKLMKTVGTIFNKIKLGIASRSWPLISPLYTYRFFAKAQQLNDNEEFDAVISIHTPIDSLLAGYYLKKIDPNIVYIPYYLDALGGGLGPKNWKQARTDKHTEWYERKVMRNADTAIVMKSAEADHLQRFKKDGFLSKYVYLDIPLVEEVSKATLDVTDSHTVREVSSKIKVLYSGTLNVSQRNPIPILEVFKIMMEKHKDVNVQFIGNCNKPELLAEYAGQTEGQISYVGPVSREEAIICQNEADVLLNIGNRNENMVPSKVFDYINLRKPIISTFLSEKDTSIVYLKKYPLAYLFDENDSDYSRHAELLYKFIRANRGKSAKFNARDTYYLNTAGAFVDAIKKVLEKRDGTTHLPEN